MCDVYLAIGEEGFRDLLGRISMSRLKTYRIFEQVKVRCRLVKLNSENLRKAAPRLWERIQQRDEALASDLAEAILLSWLDMIIEALDLIGIPHTDGFFAKDLDVSAHLKDEWQAKTYDALKNKYPPVVLRFYLNHLAISTGHGAELFTPAA